MHDKSANFTQKQKTEYKTQLVKQKIENKKTKNIPQET